MSANGSLFAAVIQEHLDLKRKNSHLDSEYPIDDYAADDPFRNHPLFKSEAAARLEDEETGDRPAIPREPPNGATGADTESLPAVKDGWTEASQPPDFRWE
jgi:hypothetical protein